MINKAIIIGAGIGGLVTAIALRRAGVEVLVYERAAAAGEMGAGLTLWANAMRGLRGLGLAEQVIAAGAPIREAAIRSWRGKNLSVAGTETMERAMGEPTIAIHRAKLHEILLGALPGEAVRFGESFANYRQDANFVAARFSNHDEARADLLIGADGIHSSVRKQMLPTVRPRYAGYTAWRAVITTPEKTAVGMTSETWGCGSRFGIVPVSDREIYWFATGNMNEGMKLTARENKLTLVERLRGWHDPIPGMVSGTPADAILRNDALDLEPLPKWSNGRVTLLGDAAHATTPNLGQGACQAIESAIALTECLAAENALPAALERYEAQRKPRTTLIMKESLKIGRVGQWENRMMCGLRNMAVSMTPDRLLKRKVMSIVNG
ncbi:MAG: FAD-dependent monooxygenase [Blastocatellia bacterium]